MTSLNPSNQQRYRSLAEQTPELPLFHQPWWLDAVSRGKAWDVAFEEFEGKLQAAWPFAVRKKGPLTAIVMPPLTHRLGVWMRASEAKSSVKLSREKDVLRKLAAKLPSVHFERHHFPTSFGWGLPLQWEGYSESIRYTYRVSPQSSEAAWTQVDDKARNDIRRAEKDGLVVNQNTDPASAFQLIAETLKRKGGSSAFDANELVTFFKSVHPANPRLWSAVDAQGEVHTTIMLVEDADTVYYLMSGGKHEGRHGGANGFLVWKAMEETLSRSKTFDFEGSMVENIERFFRGFGGTPTPYRAFTRSRPAWLGALLQLLGKQIP